VSLPGAATSESELGTDEQLRRERRREVGLGVTSFSWAASADALLVPLADGLHVLRGFAEHPQAPGHLLAVAAGELAAPIAGSSISPDGRLLAVVSGGDLFVAGAGGDGDGDGHGGAANRAPLRLTASAEDGLCNGLPEYVAEEEMGRNEGLWWSKDSSLIAYAEVDERHIPLYRIPHPGADVIGPASEEAHRYPFAGGPNAIVRLGVVPAAGGDTVWMDTGDPDRYLARAGFTDDGRLVAQLQSRDQRTLDLVAFDPASGAGKLLHRERNEHWVELHDDFKMLRDGTFLWSSERTGWRHLERRGPGGELVAVLTSGDWQVDALAGVDEDEGVVYFSGRADGPTERHLYAVPLEGGELRRLTPERGWHECVVGARNGSFVDRAAALDSPPAVRLRSLGDCSTIAVLHDRHDPLLDELELSPPELVTLPGADGTTLYGLYFAPEPAAPGDAVAAERSPQPPPLVVDVYGGPHAQRVVEDWSVTVRMRAQALRRMGCAVLTVDNRGSAGRGLQFTAPIQGRMGELEVADQLSAVRWAIGEGLADPGRVAVYGWSYGGYMSLRLLGAAPELFRAAVAGAPTTSYDGYDTHYTERYLGTPQDQPEAYARASVFPLVPSMRGELMIVHGLIDENVHFRHTARLINRLVAHGKQFELVAFPDERHLPRGEADRAYLEERVLGFLARALGLPAGD
jgi:dipeptidyl-peptidase-4